MAGDTAAEERAVELESFEGVSREDHDYHLGRWWCVKFDVSLLVYQVQRDGAA